MNKPSKYIPSWKRRTALPLSIDGVEISKFIQAEREETVVSGTEPVLKLLLAESTPGNSGGITASQTNGVEQINKNGHQ